jgi:hypothetical protein
MEGSMHIRNLFLFAVLTVGCSESHMVSRTDSGPMPLRDAHVLTDSFVARDAFLAPDAGPVGPTLTVSGEPYLSRTVARNSTGVMLANFYFATGEFPATLTSITVQRTGIGANTDFVNVYLVDLFTGLRVTTGRSINRVTDAVAFNGLNLEFTATSGHSYVLMGDLQDAIPGDQHVFEITDMTAVVAGEAQILGIFPVRSSVLTIGIVTAATLTASAGSVLPDVVIGVESDLSEFQLTAGDNGIELGPYMLTQAGSIAEADLVVNDIYRGSDRVGSISSHGGGHYSFIGTFTIPAGTTETFTVRGTASGPSGRTIRFFVEYPSDLLARDTLLDAPAHVDIRQFDGSLLHYTEVTVR